MRNSLSEVICQKYYEKYYEKYHNGVKALTIAVNNLHYH